MQISFIILFMIDLYKDNHVCACVHACVCAFVNFFVKKPSPQKLLTGLLPNFIVVFLRQRLKSSLHRYRKIRPVERYRHSSASSLSLYLTIPNFNDPKEEGFGKNCEKRRKCW